MSTKNLGPAVSGYLDPDGRAFEEVVYQSGKPVLDKELNLAAELNAGFAQSILRRAAASGWVSPDFTGNASSGAGLFVLTSDTNTLQTTPLLAHVNGWVIPVVHTGASGTNKVNLGAGPSGQGTKRTDLVVLEVWRRLLTATTATGKSQTGRIWVNGNVKVPSGSDSILNLVDDMLDGTVNAETTKRVQIQYRLRVIQNVDLFTYPAGLDDPTVFANSIPASAASPDGSASLFAYTNQSALGDSGLWRAGDGVPSNSLGTVDGYMYAIPLAAVFRRNITAFDRNANHNGGVATPGPSDRPDGLFHDILVLRDLADLRRGVALGPPADYTEVLEKNFNSLLDNALQTEWTNVSIGGGQNGHTFLSADEIGVSNANGGDGVTSGDTPGANFIGEFDNTRRRFSDRTIYEVMTVKVQPGGASVSTSTWQAGTVITLNPMSLAPHPYSAFNFPAFAPADTRIIDVVRARILGPTSGKKSVEVGSATEAGTTAYEWASITGLGEFPMGNIVLKMGTPTAGLTNEPMYIDLLIAYPSGQGLSYTPTRDFGSSSFVVNNPGNLSASAPVSFASTVGLAIDPPHREVNLEYQTSTLTFTFEADSTGPRLNYAMPERVASVVQVTLNGSPVTGNVDVATGKILTLASTSSPGDEISVQYQARRPIPQTGVQFTIYSEARAPQTIRASLLGTTVTLLPRHTPSHLYTITTGSGSVGEGYPFPFAYVQAGAVYPSALGSFSGDHLLNGSDQVTVADFGASTGFLKLPIFLPYVPNPGAVTLQRLSGDVDSEGRSYYKATPGGQYVPNAYAQPLSDTRIHKVIYPTLMEVASDGPVGRRGTLLLVVFSRWALSDPENSIRISPVLNENTTSVSLFRLNGNLLNRKV